ncbi:hypothetical protein EDB89DRAFT_1907891 [Lactarius sanguifluus]|nr:hypothetical protein EDB89DRAFT_1907891 [Lactarius sanguifluus]
MGAATDYSDSAARINAVRTRTPPATARRRTTFLRPATTNDDSEDSDWRPNFPTFAWDHPRTVSTADPPQIIVADDKKPKRGVKTSRPSVFTAQSVQTTTAATEQDTGTLSDSEWAAYASDRSTRHANRKLAARGLTQVSEDADPSTPADTPQDEAPAYPHAGGDALVPLQPSPPTSNDQQRANSPHPPFNPDAESESEYEYEDEDTQTHAIDDEDDDAQQKSFEDE